MTQQPGPLRVAFIAGTLGQGGAEKQLVHMVGALQEAGVDVRVYCLRTGEHFEMVLRKMGTPPIHVGHHPAPPIRLVRLIRHLRRYRPHVVQAAHFYVNLYAVLAARACGALAVGAIRSDAIKDVRKGGRWGPWLLRAPSALVVNSNAARARAESLGVDPAALHVIPNVLAVNHSDARSAQSRQPPIREAGTVQVLAIGGLSRAKRLDRFLTALAAARAVRPDLCGVIAGTGPERMRLETMAASLGLTSGGVRFVGHCSDIRALLAQSQMLVLTSDHEGSPNVLLEAMGAGLPVVTTPAGDSAVVVMDGTTGFVVDFEDAAGLAERILRLADSPQLRIRLGEAGRRRVAAEFNPSQLAERLLTVYRAAARRNRAAGLLALLEPPDVRTSAHGEVRCPA